MRDARVVPGNRVLVGLVGVELDSHVVAEEDVRERLEAVRVVPRDVDRDGIVLTDVLDERVARLPIEDDDAGRPLRQAKRSSWPRSW